MLLLTITLGITLMLCAHSVDLTRHWLGTSAVTAVVMLLAIAALPSCAWLLQSAVGLATTALLWLVITTFYHRLLCESMPTVTDRRRQTPMVELKRRHVAAWQFGRYTVGVAVGVSA